MCWVDQHTFFAFFFKLQCYLKLAEVDPYQCRKPPEKIVNK